MIELREYQLEVLDKIRPGCILVGKPGSGKSITSLSYYHKYHKDKKLFIITTAKKRDTLDWEKEAAHLKLIKGEDFEVDSWNNIKKYVDINNCFFIFDEQRVVGYGVWTKSFLKITKTNQWILLSATPGDTWSDYMPVFIANRFYKNKTEFTQRHVIYSRFSKFPQIDRYIETGRLLKYRNQILVVMKYHPHTIRNSFYIYSKYDKDIFDLVYKKRWNSITNLPIKNSSELCYLMRRVVNSSEDRLNELNKILNVHKKVLIFYNFDYELFLLKELMDKLKIPFTQLNGHKHEDIIDRPKWAHLVQYSAGNEAWNCIETDTIIFFSQTYSYKVLIQSMGRIDRMNTEFSELNYFHLISKSPIDNRIRYCLQMKKDFNASSFDSRKKHTV